MDDAIRPSGAKCAAHCLRVESVRDQGLSPEGVKLVGPRAGTGGPRDLVASFDLGVPRSVAAFHLDKLAALG